MNHWGGDQTKERAMDETRDRAEVDEGTKGERDIVIVEGKELRIRISIKPRRRLLALSLFLVIIVDDSSFPDQYLHTVVYWSFYSLDLRLIKL